MRHWTPSFRKPGMRTGCASGETRWPRAEGGETLFLRKIWQSTRTRWQRFALFAFILWALYTLILSPHGWLQLMSAREDVRALKQEMSELERRRDALDKLENEMAVREPYQLEKRAREEFGYARENERIYLLPRNADDDRCLTDGELRGGDCFSDRPAAKKSAAMP